MIRTNLFKRGIIISLWFFTTTTLINGLEKNGTLNGSPKVLSVFNVISFPNDNCQGGTRNGTCYTSDECNDLGGNNDGSCASGFGVCCTFVLSCGGSSSQNCTYIEMASFTVAPTTNPCTYTLTRSADTVCRIRLDFTTLSIQPPLSGEVGESAPEATTGAVIGDCTGDSLTISSPGMTSPPIICGFNNGQHMFLDSNGASHILSFSINGANTAVTRQWNIKATNYECGSTLGGPPGCLQYHTASTGRISSFNFDTTITEIPATPNAHLSNQNYELCFRRAPGNCAICYAVAIDGASPVMAAMQASFGLSIVSGSINVARTDVDTNCLGDYLEVPEFLGSTAIANMATIQAVIGSRICGRYIGTDGGLIAGRTTTICTRSLPFRLRFVTDADEGTTAASAVSNELTKVPGGIIGFSLNYAQLTCT